MKIRNRSILVGAVVLAATMTASACSSGGSSSPGASGGKPSAVFAVNGALGDQGFFDDAERGMQTMKSHGNKVSTIQAEAGSPAQWKSNVESVSTGSWDIVIVGTSQMNDIMTATAKKFPNQKYIIFDTVVNGPNVASITYKQNEGSFLAGVLAALATSSPGSFPLSRGNKTVGLVGGMDIPVINDFVSGFKAGVTAVDPSIKVQVSYVGSFTDSAKGYDQAKAMFSGGADVVFQVAGGSGIGVLQAAKDANKYAIGVDGNQNALQPGHVLASMLKHVGNSLVLAVDAAQAGKLQFGKATSYGLANNGVGLDFDNNSSLVPQSIIQKVDEYKKKVIDGTITVPTAAQG